jgi:small subunit ribosomal protein S9
MAEKTEVVADIKTQYWATGRRKESIARVRLVAGDGKITVNSREFADYFPRESHRLIIMQPLELTKTVGKFSIFANVLGGGTSGQAEAVRHGIARALVKSDESLKAAVKKAGFLTRDPRMRERKKYGRKRARRRFQFTKR